MITPDEVFKIGRIGRPHGLRGEIDFHFTDDVFDRVEADYLVCCIDGLLVPFFMEEWRFRGADCAIIKFANLDNDDEVRILQNADVFFPRSLAEDRGEEITSWQVLTGFAVSDKTAGLLGTIQNVDESSANVLIEIQSDKNKDLLLPIHPDLVADVDVKARTLMLDLPEGLLLLN